MENPTLYIRMDALGVPPILGNAQMRLPTHQCNSGHLPMNTYQCRSWRHGSQRSSTDTVNLLAHLSADVC